MLDDPWGVAKRKRSWTLTALPTCNLHHRKFLKLRWGWRCPDLADTIFFFSDTGICQYASTATLCFAGSDLRWYWSDRWKPPPSVFHYTTLWVVYRQRRFTVTAKIQEICPRDHTVTPFEPSHIVPNWCTNKSNLVISGFDGYYQKAKQFHQYLGTISSLDDLSPLI